MHLLFVCKLSLHHVLCAVVGHFLTTTTVVHIRFLHQSLCGLCKWILSLWKTVFFLCRCACMFGLWSRKFLRWECRDVLIWTGFTLNFGLCVLAVGKTLHFFSMVLVVSALHFVVFAWKSWPEGVMQMMWKFDLQTFEILRLPSDLVRWDMIRDFFFKMSHREHTAASLYRPSPKI